MWRISGNVPALQPKYRDLATLETKTPAAARGPAAPLRFLRANDVLTQLSLFGNGLEDNGAAAGCVPPHELNRVLFLSHELNRSTSCFFLLKKTFSISLDSELGAWF
jgi:hypothetical protein